MQYVAWLVASWLASSVKLRPWIADIGQMGSAGGPDPPWVDLLTIAGINQAHSTNCRSHCAFCPCRKDLRLAAGNLPWVDVLPVAGANVYSILQRDYLMVSQAAAAALAERGSRVIHRKPERLRPAPTQAV